MFRETETFGIRRYPVQRHKLQREACTVETPWGPVRGKRGWREGRTAGVHAGVRGLRCIASAPASQAKLPDVRRVYTRSASVAGLRLHQLPWRLYQPAHAEPIAR